MLLKIAENVGNTPGLNCRVTRGHLGWQDDKTLRNPGVVAKLRLSATDFVPTEFCRFSYRKSLSRVSELPRHVLQPPCPVAPERNGPPGDATVDTVGEFAAAPTTGGKNGLCGPESPLPRRIPSGSRGNIKRALNSPTVSLLDIGLKGHHHGRGVKCFV